MNINNVKSEFPILQEKLKGKPLIYLDNANSAQKPKSVIDRISKFYKKEFSNIGRSVHKLAGTQKPAPLKLRIASHHESLALRIKSHFVLATLLAFSFRSARASSDTPLGPS